MNISDAWRAAGGVTRSALDSGVMASGCLVLVVMALGGCGGGGGGAAPVATTPTPAAPIGVTITEAPSNVSTAEGRTVIFTVRLQVSGAPSYQWLRNGVAIPGATGSSYAMPAVTMSDDGAQFALMISNNGTSVTSAAATLTVLPTPLSVSQQPANAQGRQGAAVTLSAGVSGHGTLTMQWQRSADGGQSWSDVAGANQSALSLAQLTFEDAGLYRLVASDGAGTVASAAAALSVRPNLHVLAGAIGGAGYVDGAAGVARLASPADAVVAPDGSIIVSQPPDFVFRKIAPDGTTSTHFKGPAYNFANNQSKLALDATGNIYFASYSSVQKLSADGKTVSLLAGGNSAQQGLLDGQGADARFVFPNSLTSDAQGNIYVADTSNYAIRKITPAGVVTTLLGGAGSGTEGVLKMPRGVAMAANGDLYIADTYNYVIRRLSAGGVLSTVAGALGYAGAVDGATGVSRLQLPTDIAIDGRSNLIYIADSTTIRKLTLAGDLSTLAGQPGVDGSVDGAGAVARFRSEMALAIDHDGNVIISDTMNHVVKRMTPAGTVSTLSGQGPVAGAVNAQGGSARFDVPVGLARGRSGALYVADSANHVIRKIDALGNVSVLAGKFGDASFIASPKYIAVDSVENAYVTTSGGLVFKIKPDGTVVQLAQAASSGNGNGAATLSAFANARGITVDGADNVYILHSDGILKMTPAGTTSVIAVFTGASGYGDGPVSKAGFWFVKSLVADAEGNLYIGDSCAVRKITPDGNVITLAGYPSYSGYLDGQGETARFSGIDHMAVDARGNVFVGDTAGVRRISSTGYVSTVIESYVGYRSGEPRVVENQANGVLSYANATGGLALTADGRLIMVSENAVLVTE